MSLELDEEFIKQRRIPVPFSELSKEQKAYLLKWLLEDLVPSETKHILGIAELVAENVRPELRELAFKAAVQIGFRQPIQW